MPSTRLRNLRSPCSSRITVANSYSIDSPQEQNMGTINAFLMITMGLGIAGIWTMDIVSGSKVDLSAGFFRARDGDDGPLLWPHWIAESATAAPLIAGGLGLLFDAAWSPAVAALGVGALFYTSVNSLGWALASRERRPYAAPMIAGVLVSVLSGVYLIAR